MQINLIKAIITMKFKKQQQKRLKIIIKKNRKKANKNL